MPFIGYMHRESTQKCITGKLDRKKFFFGKFKMGRNLLSTTKTSKNNDNHNNNNNDNGNNNNNSILALLYLQTLFTQTVSTSAR